MSDYDVQTDYWNDKAASGTFSHPLPLMTLRGLLPPAARILDVGCGYGRTCAALTDAGYRNVIGIDISGEMIRRGRALRSDLDLRVFDGKSPGFARGSFDACLLVAVLNCIPSDAGQEQVIEEMRRLLRPGGVLFLSDYPLQTDERNRGRYRECSKELGAYGMFRTGGAVFRHHDMKRIDRLLSGFEIFWRADVRVRTMNGNEADAFQLLARRKSG